MSSPSAVVAKIRQEAALFDTKDRLLNFATKNDFQSPLVMEAGDLFFEKWLQAKGPLPLESFFKVSANFTAQQKITAIDAMTAVLRNKLEDFGETDLYLVLGFLKWDGNALAPSLLIPLDADPVQKTLQISKRTPIENVILRERLKDSVTLPTAEDAVINGKFSLLLYFSLFEKAIASNRNWKFTRHGLCLSFFNTDQLLLKKRMALGFQDKTINANPALASLFSEDGFQTQESLFEEQNFDKVFSPADHHFLYTTDSHTDKVIVDALNDQAKAYAIQALPGTDKMKVAANIVADSVAKGQKVLVVHRRAVSGRAFKEAWKPAFRSFPQADRSVLEQDVRKMRAEFQEYYDTVNNPIAPANVPLANLLEEFIAIKPSKHKYPASVLQGISSLNYQQYQDLKKDLLLLNELYFDKKGIEARKAFQGVKLPGLDAELQQTLSQELNRAASRATSLDGLIKIMEATGLFPTGIFLSSLADTLEIIRDHFNKDTPEFEDWQLRSHNWTAYRDTLTALPEAGDQWVRYRRQTSEIYTDTAVDENIQSAREDFAESQKATLKGLSDRYRSSRRKLLSVLRNPKNVESDAHLLDLIDTLLELQANKRAYKESAVLGNHLLGKDWHYERSNWVELNTKIQFIYEFRDNHKNDPKLDLLLQILEQWHLFKEMLPQIDELYRSVLELQQSIKQINKAMELETPLESLSIEKWLGKIKSWSENWEHLDIHVQLTALFKKMESYPCKGLVQFISDPENADKELINVVSSCWSREQIQNVTKTCPNLFTQPPKERSKKSKAYRELLDKFSNANFSELHQAVEKNPDALTHLTLSDTFRISEKTTFDIALILDADSISIAEAIPTILAAGKTILVGDPHNPALEFQPLDAFQDQPFPHSPFFQESILTAALRQGIPTRELWFSSLYGDAALVSFANSHIYNHGIKQFPTPSSEPFKGIRLKVVDDKVNAIAQAALQHAERHPEKTLGIIAFHQSTCREIEDAIRAQLLAGTPMAAFFSRPNQDISFFVKTPDRAVDRFRDAVLICGEPEIASNNKVATCSTLAKKELQVFISESDSSKGNDQKHTLFHEWINHLQNKEYNADETTTSASSPLREQVLKALSSENIQAKESFSRGGIPVGPVIIDANNPNRYLALIEDDCTAERFRDSVEDRDYIRPQILKQLGWKVMNLWLPFWFMAQKDEVGHLVATIAIEQSVAPPPSAATEEEDDSEVFANSAPTTVPYQVQHPKIEGTAHDKPIAELPTAALITQLKFYVDSEAPIHQDILILRILELHHVDRMGPILQKALTEAINQGLQKKRFIKTGPFFYSLKPKELAPRNRTGRPDFERKLAYVAPEERALMPQSMDEHALKEAMGLLE